MGLVLTFKQGEVAVIDRAIEVKVAVVLETAVKLAFNAPPHVKILRQKMAHLRYPSAASVLAALVQIEADCAEGRADAALRRVRSVIQMLTPSKELDQ